MRNVRIDKADVTLNAIKLRLIAWLARSLVETRSMTKPLPDPIAEGFRRSRQAARTQVTVITCIHSLAELLMANKDDLDAELNRTEQAVSDDETQDDLDISERDATIKAQQALIEELQAGQIDIPAAITRLQGIQSKLHKGGATA
jgi:hypothetical protein